jgi:hypothetical protein
MNDGSTTEAHPAPSGLGGWLILVGLGLIVAPIRLLIYLVQTFPPIFRDGAWEVLTTPGSDAYHPLWASLLVGEIACHLVFVGAEIALLVFFFQHSRRFPTLYIVVAIANLLFIIADAWLGSLVLPDEPMFDPDTARELGRSVVGVAVWVPYMLVSKRVKNTFIQ